MSERIIVAIESTSYNPGMSSQVKGFFSLLLCALIFASFSIWVRLLDVELLPYQQIGFRNSLALVISILVIAITRQSFRSMKAVSPWWLLAYTLTFPIAVVLYTLSVLQVPIMTTIFGLYLGSLITSLVVGISIFKESITLPKIISLGLVLLGLITYIYPFQSEMLSIGLLLAVASGGFDALANSFRKFLAGKIDRFVLVSLQMIGGLCVAGALMLVFQQTTLPSLSPVTWLIGLIFGLSLVAISYLTLVGFSNFDLNLGTVVLSTELFFAALLGYLVFKEAATPTQILGGALLLVASGITNVSEQQFRNLFSKK